MILKNNNSKRVVTFFSKLLYPPRCIICDDILMVHREGCCSECETKLPWTKSNCCMCCGKQLENPEQEYCQECSGGNRFFTQGTAAFVYDGNLRRSITRMKYYNRRDYISFYAKCMGRTLQQYLPVWRIEQIIPVPMHPTKKRKRGYNQSELLAEELAEMFGIPVNKKLIQCVKKPEDQKHLNREERLQNLHGCFQIIRQEPMPSRVLIVDDVYTTGSTMDEVSRTLKIAGIKHIYFVVLCTGKEKKTVSIGGKLCYTDHNRQKRRKAK